jgi:hypothetical protein
VPPPTALKTRKPWRPVQLSASLRMRSSTRSTIPEADAVVGELADAVEHEVDDLLADGVVAARPPCRR